SLSHRGACGCEVDTGDGAGLLFQIPDEFLRKVCAPLGIKLPERPCYGTGILFLPRGNQGVQQTGKVVFERIVAEEGQRFLGWRPVPTDNRTVGASARAVEPDMVQAFVGWGERIS